MELGVFDEIDLTLFIYNRPNAQGHSQDFFKRCLFFAWKEHGITLLGILLIGAFVIDEGVLDIPLAKLQPAGGNSEIRVDLVVEAFEDRAAGFENSTNTGRISTASFDLNRDPSRTFHFFFIMVVGTAPIAAPLQLNGIGTIPDFSFLFHNGSRKGTDCLRFSERKLQFVLKIACGVLNTTGQFFRRIFNGAGSPL